MTAAEIISAIAALSEGDCKAVRIVANTRARALESERVTAEVKQRFAYFAALPLGTKIRYQNDPDTPNRVRGASLGFEPSRTYILCQVKRGRKPRGIWLVTRFDDPTKSWVWVPDTALASTKWIVLETTKQEV